MGVRGLATYFGNRDLFFDEVIFWDFSCMSFLKLSQWVTLKDLLDCKNKTGVAQKLQGHHWWKQLTICTLQMVPGAEPLLWGWLWQVCQVCKVPYSIPTNCLPNPYRYVRQFIGRLHRSGIRPIVVFDGGHDKSDQKLATVISRMTEQSRNAVACNSVTQVLILDMH